MRKILEIVLCGFVIQVALNYNQINAAEVAIARGLYKAAKPVAEAIAPSVMNAVENHPLGMTAKSKVMIPMNIAYDTIHHKIYDTIHHKINEHRLKINKQKR